MDIGLRKELRGTIRQMLDDVCIVDLSAALLELGWDELRHEHPDAVDVLFEELGRALRPSDALDGVVTGALTGLPANVHQVLYVVAASPNAAARFDGVVLRVPADDSHLLAVSGDATSSALGIVQLDPSATGAVGMEPDGPFRTVRTAGPPTPVDLDPDSWTRAVAAGRRALANELVGIGRSAIEVAVAHVSDRHQFGRPLGSFQAVQHRLADAYVDLEAAAMLCDESRSASDDLNLATGAKSSAARACAKAGAEAQQVCGAIAMAWEHPMHRILRRSAVLDMLLGRHRALTQSLGRHLLAAGNARGGAA